MAENKKKNIATKKGYSLVEVLVSLVILSLGLLGVVYLMNSNTKSSLNSRNEIIASELAQEGIELVLNLNGNNYIFATGSNTNYTIDYKGVLSSSGQSANAEKLYLDNNGFFNHSPSSTATKFLRKIDISGESGPGSQVTVTSTVSWNNASFPATCTIASQCLSVTAVLVSNK